MVRVSPERLGQDAVANGAASTLLVEVLKRLSRHDVHGLSEEWMRLVQFLQCGQPRVQSSGQRKDC